ncbi:hypothetical protein Smp_135690 [Schistosoma mansoni]|uniref:hypothetical protein n=1 Tax=Schistosoma mansoni TaxID=6183 RepID=UPI0001A635BC|nr:hypothetical protein Smp_135690 [Schistosoma mansoni]|eukprot:XP_018653206.1 hypothetical protein Smp_135690 [Schistosoma mansoni]
MAGEYKYGYDTQKYFVLESVKVLSRYGMVTKWLNTVEAINTKLVKEVLPQAVHSTVFSHTYKHAHTVNLLQRQFLRVTGQRQQAKKLLQ